MNINNNKVISIEGIIGAGKTSIFEDLKNYFKDKDNIIFIPEPVNDWLQNKDSKGENILTKFYNNQKRYSFTFQVNALITRVKQLKEALENNENSIIIVERSIYTDKNVFCRMLYDDGLIDDIELNIYNNVFNELVKDININGIIYIHCEPSICYQRVKKRDREGENNIPLEYLEKLNTYQQDYLKKFDFVLSYNNNFDMDEIESEKVKKLIYIRSGSVDNYIHSV